jgi:cytochrome c oxidase assembly protein subunit 15
MRHTGAGLAIPDFPWMFGHVVPDHWSTPIAIHFAHRVGAVLVTVGVIASSAYVWSRRRDRPELTRPATLVLALVAVQVTLGALTVLTRRDVWINSLHVVCGALVLTTSLVLTLRSWRVRFGVARAISGADLATIDGRRGGPVCPPGPTRGSAPTQTASGVRA